VTTVVVADDQPVICAGFAALLDAQPDLEVVGTAPDGQALVGLVERTRPDIALTDIRMPVMDGIEAARLITADHPTRVLMLTTFDLDAYVYDAIRAGASGFLLKDVTAERLVEAVRMVADGAMLLARPPVGAWSRHSSTASRGRGPSRRPPVISARGSGRCCSSSPAVGPTPRSPGISTSASRP